MRNLLSLMEPQDLLEIAEPPKDAAYAEPPKGEADGPAGNVCREVCGVWAQKSDLFGVGVNMRALLLFTVMMLAGCDKAETEGVVLPNLFNGEKIMHSYKHLTPLGWAYCLDMTTGEEKGATERAFEKACKADPKLLDKVANLFSIKAKVTRRCK